MASFPIIKKPLFWSYRIFTHHRVHVTPNRKRKIVFVKVNFFYKKLPPNYIIPQKITFVNVDFLDATPNQKEIEKSRAQALEIYIARVLRISSDFITSICSLTLFHKYILREFFALKKSSNL